MTWQSTPCSAVIGVRCLSTRLAAWSRRLLFTEQLICEIVWAHAITLRYDRGSLCDCAKSFRERPTRASRFVSRRRMNSDKDHMRWRRRGIRRDRRVIFFSLKDKVSCTVELMENYRGKPDSENRRLRLIFIYPAVPPQAAGK